VYHIVTLSPRHLVSRCYLLPISYFNSLIPNGDFKEDGFCFKL
jgi:hypothetical protein